MSAHSFLPASTALSSSPLPWLSRLAAVEVQLCMQLLTAAEIIKLARCSRFMLHCADEPHAWRCCPPVAIAVTSSEAIGASLACRHAPSMLIWGEERSFTKDHRDGWKPVDEPHLATANDVLRIAAAMDPRRIRGFNAYHQLSTAGLIAILQHQAFAGLEIVILPGPGIGKAVVDASIVDALTALPRLHTLRLADVGSGALASLYRCPSLTDLIVNTFTVVFPAAQIADIAHCSYLVRLSFTAGNTSYPLQDLQLSPSFAHLQHLRLLVWSAHSSSGIDASLSASLSSMSSLHTLSLAYSYRVDDVLRSLCTHATAGHPFPATLRLIVVEPDLADLGKTEPSQEGIAHALRAIPQISVTLLLSLSLRVNKSSQQQAVVADKVCSRFSGGDLLPPFCSRFRIESTIASSASQSPAESKPGLSRPAC